jgi:phospholipid/cholesterol/gamma-HCH transport system permease protein
MCADLGARIVREERDALRLMGINRIRAVVVPRVLPAKAVAPLLSSVVILVGLVGSFALSAVVACSRSQSGRARMRAGGAVGG